MIPPPIRIEQKLFSAAEIPNNMVFVPGGDYRLVAWARPLMRVSPLTISLSIIQVSHGVCELINSGGVSETAILEISVG